MILTEYDAALHIRSEKKLSYEEGERSGIQQGIFALIHDYLEENVPAERILQKLQKHFGLTQEEAQEYLVRFEEKQRETVMPSQL